MASRPWIRIDKIMRWAHLYTGLFLAPWFLIYGASALLLNHRAWVTEHLPVAPPQWELLQQEQFTPHDGFPAEQNAAAAAILEHVDLEGAHRVLPQSNHNQLIIMRICGTGNYRVTWMRGRSQIKIEKQTPFSVLRLIHFLHFRAGYAQRYPVHIIWAAMVDLVAVSMWLWVLSGIYLWARHSRKRIWGLLIGGGGIAVFAVSVIMLCS